MGKSKRVKGIVRICFDCVKERGVALADDAAYSKAVGSKVLGRCRCS